MNVRKFFQLLLIYVVLVLAGTAAYIVSFRTPLFSGTDVFFFRGIYIILFWGLVIAAAMFCLKIFKFGELITARDILLLFAGFCCVHVVIFTHLPVTADRSITVFMLGYMSDNAEQDFSEQEIEEYFISKYVDEYGAFDKRFHEQVYAGTIEETSDGRYRITENGIKLMKIYDTTAKLYLLDDKLIHPDK